MYYSMPMLGLLPDLEPLDSLSIWLLTVFILSQESRKGSCLSTTCFSVSFNLVPKGWEVACLETLPWYGDLPPSALPHPAGLS